VRLKTDLLKSNLDLKGTVHPGLQQDEKDGGGKDASGMRNNSLKVPFLIRGTLEEPTFEIT